MGWKMDKPLISMADEEMNASTKKVWEGESLGGISEDNNRLPQPVVWLLGITIITAFLITFPLWGQRPTAEIYVEYINMMDSPQVQAIEGDAAKMKYIAENAIAKTAKQQNQWDQHPVTLDDLNMIKDQVIELQRQGVDLSEYTVVGPNVVLANFEGNWKPDGTRERKQPWWDKGYTIDIFYVAYFCISVLIVIKRLPHFSWQPDHSIAH